jgi:hypothetical protein
VNANQVAEVPAAELAIESLIVLDGVCAPAPAP